MNDLNIIGGKIVSPYNIVRRNIGIKNGKIVQLTSKEPSPAQITYNAAHKLIFAGAIDTHTHIRGGKFSYREDFYSGTCAAAAGGVTTVLEMPGGEHPASTPKYFAEKLKEMKDNICIDCALYAGVGHDNIHMVPMLAAQGAIGFKAFMMPPVKGREQEFFGMCLQTDKDLINAMTAVKKTGLTLTLHCEDCNIIRQATQQMKASGGSGAYAYTLSRPSQAEITAVQRAVSAAITTGCKVNIAHTSTAIAAQIAAAAVRTTGADVCCETTANYMYFNNTQIDEYGVFARMKPPFRSPDDVKQLKKLYDSGVISYTGSDHAPFTYHEKTVGGSIWNAPDGLCGIEMTIPLLLELAYKGDISLESIARNTSYNAACRFGLTNKGSIEINKDADIVIAEFLNKPYKCSTDNMHIKCKESAMLYNGLMLHGAVAATVSGGKLVYSKDRGENFVRGSGKIIKSVGSVKNA